MLNKVRIPRYLDDDGNVAFLTAKRRWSTKFPDPEEKEILLFDKNIILMVMKGDHGYIDQYLCKTHRIVSSHIAEVSGNLIINFLPDGAYFLVHYDRISKREIVVRFRLDDLICAHS